MLYNRLYLEWALVALVAAVLLALSTARGWLDPLDNRLQDAAQRLVAPAPDPSLLLVDIDEQSLARIGRWPWPREVHARMLDRLAAASPAGIGYDVLFLEPGEGDARLAASLRRAGHVYLPALIDRDMEEAGRASRIVLPVSGLARAAAGIGLAQFVPDADGVVRRVPPPLPDRAKPIPQLPALLAGGRQIHPGEGELIAWMAPGALPRVSFAAMLAGEVPAAAIAGKRVLVGATAGGMAAAYGVPGPAGGVMPGVEIQANMLNTAIADAAVAPLAPATATLLGLVPLAVLLVGFLRLSPVNGFALAIALTVLVLVLTLALLVLGHRWFPPASAMACLLLVHALWGWRRLTVIRRFVLVRAEVLAEEPGLVMPVAATGTRGDALANEAERLDELIGQLRGLRRFVSEVVEQMPEAVCVVAPSGMVALGNRAADRLFGQAVRGRRFDELMAGLSPARQLEGAYATGDGGAIIMAASELTDGHRVVTFADVTELQRAAEERDDVLQFLSHDIRAPNAAIVTLLETMAISGEAGQADGQIARTIARIRGHAGHALQLADDFVQLARARRRPIEPEPVDLCDVAREAIDMLWPRASWRGVVIADGIENGETWVMGDRSMILRAVVNLLENGVKFAPAGGTVKIATRIDGEWSELTVAGPGPEMPPGRAEEPFALFAEGRDAEGATSLGLGLAFVQTTATRHEGSVSYAYLHGAIAEFRMKLPLAAPEA